MNYLRLVLFFISLIAYGVDVWGEVDRASELRLKMLHALTQPAPLFRPTDSLAVLRAMHDIPRHEIWTQEMAEIFYHDWIAFETRVNEQTRHFVLEASELAERRVRYREASRLVGHEIHLDRAYDPLNYGFALPAIGIPIEGSEKKYVVTTSNVRLLGYTLSRVVEPFDYTKGR